jgi:hypothetical protein
MEHTDNSHFKIEYISTSGVYKTSFTLIILLQLFIGSIVLILVNVWFINQLYFLLTGNQFYSVGATAEWYYWLLLPLNIYGNLFLAAFSIILFSAGINKILNKLYPPNEGVFNKGSKEWKYTHRRFWNAYFPIWLARAIPIPWADIFVYRFFGVSIGKNVVAYEGYIDPEFVEIGDFTMTSLNICIFSHLIYHDKIVIKRIKIGKACVIGPHTIVSPGTVMHDRAILGANSYTWIDQELESDLIHLGTPINIKLPLQTVEESQDKAERIKDKSLDINQGDDNK